MAKALGLRLLDKAGEPIGEGCAALADLHRVDATSLHPALRETRIRIACDVNNPLCGQQGASAIYSPQKGATPWMVEYMEALLGAYAERLAQDSGAMVAHLPGSGAAGGIGVPLLSYAGASLVSGIDQVLSIMEFDERARHADLVLSGEGSIDAQTPCGKVICGLLERTPDGVPLIAFAGRLAAGYQILYERGLSSCFCILPQAMPLEQAMDRAKEYLEDAVYRALRLLQICV